MQQDLQPDRILDQHDLRLVKQQIRSSDKLLLGMLPVVVEVWVNWQRARESCLFGTNKKKRIVQIIVKATTMNSLVMVNDCSLQEHLMEKTTRKQTASMTQLMITWKADGNGNVNSNC